MPRRSSDSSFQVDGQLFLAFKELQFSLGYPTGKGDYRESLESALYECRKNLKDYSFR